MLQGSPLSLSTVGIGSATFSPILPSRRSTWLLVTMRFSRCVSPIQAPCHCCLICAMWSAILELASALLLLAFIMVFLSSVMLVSFSLTVFLHGTHWCFHLSQSFSYKTRRCFHINIFTVGNMRVMICLGQGGLHSLSASSFHLSRCFYHGKLVCCWLEILLVGQLHHWF